VPSGELGHPTAHHVDLWHPAHQVGGGGRWRVCGAGRVLLGVTRLHPQGAEVLDIAVERRHDVLQWLPPWHP
jgi:hypothetical protein